MNPTAPTPAEPPVPEKEKYRTPMGQRNIRVLVSEQVFVHLHDMAVQSRMRFQPYLRRWLAEARPFAASPSNLARTFASGNPVPEPGDDAKR